jgi:hypothetical protein
LKINKKGIPFLDLDINNSIAQELRPLLSSFLEEDEKEDITFIDKLVRLLKL